MDFARDTLVTFRALCRQYHLSPAELATSFVKSLPAVTSLVLGCETPSQVEENVALMDRTAALSPEQLSEIRRCFIGTPSRVLNPMMW